MFRPRLSLLLAAAGLALFVVGKQEDAPSVMIAAAGVIGMALAVHYDPAMEALLRWRRPPVLHDAGLWLLTSSAAIGVCGAIELLMRLPSGDVMARVEWTLQFIGSLLPALPIVTARRFPCRGSRPRLWPIAAALAGWLVYWTAGWLLWRLVTTALVDPWQVDPLLALWCAPPLSPLLAIGGLLWWRALARSPCSAFDDAGMFGGVIAFVMGVIAALIAGAGVVLLVQARSPGAAAQASGTAAWMLAACVAVAWLIVLARIRAVPPRRAGGAVAATAILILSLGASFIVPIGLADVRRWWQIALVFVVPVVVATVVIVLTGVPRLVIAALRR